MVNIRIITADGKSSKVFTLSRMPCVGENVHLPDILGRVIEVEHYAAAGKTATPHTWDYDRVMGHVVITKLGDGHGGTR